MRCGQEGSRAFLVLIIATVIVGIIGGIGYQQIVASITKGFGGTLGSIGIIIGFGVMMGQLFEVSGAAKRMALSFLKLFGKGREEIGHGHHGLPRLDPDLLQFRLHHPDAAGQGNLL
ncbi:hypothetical protein [Selenomonas bovis]|uniref:GntT/GntP/DsdX family permease n=1 Tax=Selenomonas bovis TaxID=416586 RepID=UPI003D06E84A